MTPNPFTSACSPTSHLTLSNHKQNLAYFVRTHERALANALHLQHQKTKNGKDHTSAAASSSKAASSTTISLAEALTRPYLSFASHNIRPAKLTLTPHHLFYLLSKFEDLGVDVGPMTVRLENLHSDAAPSNYVSFLGHAPKSRGKQSDADSLRSVSSVRSVMSSMSSMWSTLTLSNSAAKAEKKMAQYREDLKYLYSCFTKIPSLRLAPDSRARLISGFEEFPFDTAVPLFAFKNVSSLEICELDFRQFHGWDRLAEQLRSLILNRAGVDDPLDVLQDIVLDDAERRRKRSSKTHQVPTTPSTSSGWMWSNSPKTRELKDFKLDRSYSSPVTSINATDSRRASAGGPPLAIRLPSADGSHRPRQPSDSPSRPSTTTSRPGSWQKSQTGRPSISNKTFRSSSGSSGSSQHEMTPRHSSSDLLSMGILPPSKWRFLRHLSLAENGLAFLTTGSLAPVAGTLQSLDLSGNLFSEIPDALAGLSHLRALNLSNCMIDSLSSLLRSPLPAITTLNLRSNRLLSLAGIERLYSLERLDLRDNRLHDPTELARLTGIPEVHDLYVVKNPFTKTHGSYRITIFNVFRSSPGHTDDVIIDSMGPLYHEKKHLVDRVPEPANKPIVQAPDEDEASWQAEEELTNAGVQAIPERSAHGSHRRTTSDLGPKSSLRRKKAPRRRIVELAQAEQRTTTRIEEAVAEPPVPELTELPPMPHTPTTESDQPSTPEATPYHTAPSTQLAQQQPSLSIRPRLDVAFTSPTPKIRRTSDDDNSPVRSPHDMGSNTDVYRQKIEALKQELGPNWLSALNEERLTGPQPRHRSFSPAPRTSAARPDRPSRGVSVGGRTLG